MRRRSGAAHAVKAAEFRRRLKREEQRAGLEAQIEELKRTLELRDAQILYERERRVHAQRGLVVYVRALESFNAWLDEHSNEEVAEALRKRGLFAVKLGYDPDQDPEIVGQTVRAEPS